MWPQVTAAAASDAFLLAWISTALRIVGPGYGPARTDALACFLAHVAFNLDPEGILGTGNARGGAVASQSSAELSVSYSTMAPDSIDAALASTSPGRMILMLRDSRADIAPPMVV